MSIYVCAYVDAQPCFNNDSLHDDAGISGKSDKHLFILHSLGGPMGWVNQTQDDSLPYLYFMKDGESDACGVGDATFLLLCIM